MNAFYATFAPGFQDCVAALLRERLPGVRVGKLLEGAVLFETAVPYEGLKFFCFNNVFAVISLSSRRERRAGGSTPGGPALSRELREHLQAAGRGHPVIRENPRHVRSFRVVCSRENQPAAVEPRARAEAEGFLAREAGLRVDRARPDTEFWFLWRREGFSLFMKRLTRRPSWEKTLHPGELPPPLAWLLCYLSRPRPGDVVVDPFCGYGAIPAERLKRFPLKKCYALDSDPGALAWTERRLTREVRGAPRPRWETRRVDFRRVFEVLPPGSVDAIITDPPWGLYRPVEGAAGPGGAGPPLEAFYEDMLRVFARLLRAGGRAVTLTGGGGALERALERVPGFQVTTAFPVLVSGKKAVVHLLTLPSPPPSGAAPPGAPGPDFPPSLDFSPGRT